MRKDINRREVADVLPIELQSLLARKRSLREGVAAVFGQEDADARADGGRHSHATYRIEGVKDCAGGLVQAAGGRRAVLLGQLLPPALFDELCVLLQVPLHLLAHVEHLLVERCGQDLGDGSKSKHLRLQRNKLLGVIELYVLVEGHAVQDLMDESFDVIRHPQPMLQPVGKEGLDLARDDGPHLQPPVIAMQSEHLLQDRSDGGVLRGQDACDRGHGVDVGGAPEDWVVDENAKLVAAPPFPRPLLLRGMTHHLGNPIPAHNRR
mmetsp:Transcript_112433/g.298696  ORF Transcript_112433/g.298696 Transcript_112433/m.298696 type:complete len:265 (-) Transcript_112433:308-1102(-)